MYQGRLEISVPRTDIVSIFQVYLRMIDVCVWSPEYMQPNGL